MRRASRPESAAKPAAATPARGARPRGRLGEWPWVLLLLAGHLGLVLWGVARNSVTFDENFHLPAGVLVAARGELDISAVNPPLVKGLCGAAALAAGARLPAEAAVADGEQGLVGESFMRVNAARYMRVFVAARLVIVALSLFLGLLVWRVARRCYGPRAGILALAFYAFAPEALAHAGLVTMDLATGLSWLATVYAFWMFARSGRLGWWWAAAGALIFAFLVRLSAPLLFPVLLAIAALAWGRARRRARLAVGLALLLPAVVVGLDLGYLGQVSLLPLGRWHFLSPQLRAFQQALPGVRLPLPAPWLVGLDHQMLESQPGQTPTYLLGRVIPGSVWYYFPLAFLFKWPLGFLGGLLARAGAALTRRRHRGTFLAVPVAAYLGAGMFLSHLDVGVRYMFPLVPFLCVWLGGLVPRRAAGSGSAMARLLPRAGVALALLQAVEAGCAAPYPIAFFNLAAGGPGGGYRLVNDSNVDWGQGLIALRDEMRRRGIKRVHLAYHGTTDPAVYGIDYVPYFGGAPGTESDWLAVSSYYFVGLKQRMMTPKGRTPAVRFDFSRLQDIRPAARLGGSIYLFPLRGAGL